MYSGAGFPYTLITAIQMGLSVFQENISFLLLLKLSNLDKFLPKKLGIIMVSTVDI